jgi:hypothetical protein
VFGHRQAPFPLRFGLHLAETNGTARAPGGAVELESDSQPKLNRASRIRLGCNRAK